MFLYPPFKQKDHIDCCQKGGGIDIGRRGNAKRVGVLSNQGNRSGTSGRHEGSRDFSRFFINFTSNLSVPANMEVGASFSYEASLRRVFPGAAWFASAPHCRQHHFAKTYLIHLFNNFDQACWTPTIAISNLKATASAKKVSAEEIPYFWPID